MRHADDFARLFIALWPDPAMREQLRAWRDSFGWPKPAAPVPTQQLHVTLHFLGDIARGRLPELARGLEVGFAPFTLALEDDVLWVFLAFLAFLAFSLTRSGSRSSSTPCTCRSHAATCRGRCPTV